MPDFLRTPSPHTDEVLSSACQNPSLGGSHKKPGTALPLRGPLYQVATYLASLDQLFDEQASILREQTHRAEQAELAVRMHQIWVAQVETRAAAAVSSEAVAQESLR